MNKGAEEERVCDEGELVRDEGELVCDERGERVCKRRNNEDNESVTIRHGWDLGGLADFLQ